MTGGGLPQDEQTKKKVPNLRLEALKDIRSYAKHEVNAIGIYVGPLRAPQGTAADIMSPNGWVNTPDTWVSKVADDTNHDVGKAMREVMDACEKIFSVIDSEIGKIHANGMDEVPEGHPDAKWVK